MASRSYQTLNRDKTINRTTSETSSGNATLRRENTGLSRVQSIECTGQFVLVDKKNPSSTKDGDRLLISNGVLRLMSGLAASSKMMTASDSSMATLLLGAFSDVTFAADARTGGGIIHFHKPDASDSASLVSKDPYATNSTSSLAQSATLPTFSLPVSHTLTLLKPPDLSVHNPHSTDQSWDLFVAISAQHLLFGPHYSCHTFYESDHPTSEACRQCSRPVNIAPNNTEATKIKYYMCSMCSVLVHPDCKLDFECKNRLNGSKPVECLTHLKKRTANWKEEDFKNYREAFIYNNLGATSNEVYTLRQVKLFLYLTRTLSFFPAEEVEGKEKLNFQKWDQLQMMYLNAFNRLFLVDTVMPTAGTNTPNALSITDYLLKNICECDYTQKKHIQTALSSLFILNSMVVKKDQARRICYSNYDVLNAMLCKTAVDRINQPFDKFVDNDSCSLIPLLIIRIVSTFTDIKRTSPTEDALLVNYVKTARTVAGRAIFLLEALQKRFKGKGKLEADNVFFDAAQKKEIRIHRRDCVVFNMEKLIKDSALLLFAVRNMRLEGLPVDSGDLRIFEEASRLGQSLLTIQEYFVNPESVTLIKKLQDKHDGEDFVIVNKCTLDKNGVAVMSVSKQFKPSSEGKPGESKHDMFKRELILLALCSEGFNCCAFIGLHPQSRTIYMKYYERRSLEDVLINFATNLLLKRMNKLLCRYSKSLHLTGSRHEAFELALVNLIEKLVTCDVVSTHEIEQAKLHTKRQRLMEDKRDKKKAGKPFERESELTQVEADLLNVRDIPMVLSYNVNEYRIMKMNYGELYNIPGPLFDRIAADVLKMRNKMDLPRVAHCYFFEKAEIKEGTPFLLSRLSNYLSTPKCELDLSLVINMSLDCARGLAFLHSRGIAHKDMKPLNFLVDIHFKAYIADFGESSAVEQSYKGSFWWDAPELDKMVQERAIIDIGTACKTDVYALGLIFWHLCTIKSLPYASEFGKNFSLEEKQHFVINQARRPRFKPIRKIGLPETYHALIERMWHADPNKRPKVHEVVSILDSIPDPAYAAKPKPTTERTTDKVEKSEKHLTVKLDSGSKSGEKSITDSEDSFGELRDVPYTKKYYLLTEELWLKILDILDNDPTTPMSYNWKGKRVQPFKHKPSETLKYVCFDFANFMKDSKSHPITLVTSMSYKRRQGLHTETGRSRKLSMVPFDPNVLFKKLDKQIFAFVIKGVPLSGKLSELDCIRWSISLEIHASIIDLITSVTYDFDSASVHYNYPSTITRYPFVTEPVVSFKSVSVPVKVTLEILVGTEKRTCVLPNPIRYIPGEEDSRFEFVLSVFFPRQGKNEDRSKLQIQVISMNQQ